MEQDHGNTFSDSITDREIITERKKRIFSVKSLLLFLLSAVIVFFLLRQLDLEKTLELILQSNMGLMALAVLLYILVNFFKSVRYRVLFPQTGLFDLFVISSYHNFFNMILPARTGELTFIYYAKKISDIDVSKGLHVLLVVRVFDFIVISMIFISSLMLYYGSSVSLLLLGVGIGFFVLSVVVLLNLKFIVRFSQWCFNGITEKTGIANKGLVVKIREKLETLVGEFYGFKTRKYVPLLTVTSLAVWFLLYLLFFVVIRSFGIPMDFLRSIVGSTGGVLTNVLPINSFGSFGTLEAGWTGGFMLVGLSHQEAIITGFGSHLIELFASTLQAISCVAVTRIAGKRKA